MVYNEIMITPKQEKWLSHLSDEDIVAILPYDPETPVKFDKLKKQIQNELSNSIDVVHRGASSMGISGQGELDVYIPTTRLDFDKLVAKLTNIFGEPGTVYPLERARFVTYIEGTKAEVFAINKTSESWLKSLEFEQHLKDNPTYLESYQELKEAGNGLNTREYYRRKIEFINDILEKTK